MPCATVVMATVPIIEPRTRLMDMNVAMASSLCLASNRLCMCVVLVSKVPEMPQARRSMAGKVKAQYETLLWLKERRTSDVRVLTALRIIYEI